MDKKVLWVAGIGAAGIGAMFLFGQKKPAVEGQASTIVDPNATRSTANVPQNVNEQPHFGTPMGGTLPSGSEENSIIPSNDLIDFRQWYKQRNPTVDTSGMMFPDVMVPKNFDPNVYGTNMPRIRADNIASFGYPQGSVGSFAR